MNLLIGYMILQKKKNDRGYINFDIDEAKVKQDENGKAIDIVVREREDGEKLYYKWQW